MDGQTDRWTDRQMDGQVDGWTDGWIDGRVDGQTEKIDNKSLLSQQHERTQAEQDAPFGYYPCTSRSTIPPYVMP